MYVIIIKQILYLFELYLYVHKLVIYLVIETVSNYQLLNLKGNQVFNIFLFHLDLFFSYNNDMLTVMHIVCGSIGATFYYQ